MAAGDRIRADISEAVRGGGVNTHRASGEAEGAEASASTPLERKAAEIQAQDAHQKELTKAFMVALAGNSEALRRKEFLTLVEGTQAQRDSILRQLERAAEHMAEFALRK